MSRRPSTDAVDLVDARQARRRDRRGDHRLRGVRLRPRARAHRVVLLVVLRRLRRARQGPRLRLAWRRRGDVGTWRRCAPRSTPCSGCSRRSCRSPPRRRGAGGTTRASTSQPWPAPLAGRRRPGARSTRCARCSSEVRRAKTEAKQSQRAEVAELRVWAPVGSARPSTPVEPISPTPARSSTITVHDGEQLRCEVVLLADRPRDGARAGSVYALMHTRLGCGVALSIVAGVAPVSARSPYAGAPDADRRRRPRRPPRSIRRQRSAAIPRTAPTVSGQAMPADAVARRCSSPRRSRAPATTTTTDPTAERRAARPTRVTGRRAVYSKSRQRAWTVEADGTVSRTHLVSGRLTWNQPTPGTYTCSRARASRATSRTRRSAGASWCASPSAPTATTSGSTRSRRSTACRSRSESQLGQPLSGGCVRQATPDAELHVGLGARRHQGRRPRLSRPAEVAGVSRRRSDAVRTLDILRAAWPRPTTPEQPVRPTSRRRTWPQRLTIAAHRADVARLLRRRRRARCRPVGRVADRNLRRAQRSGSATVAANTPDIVVPGETRPPERRGRAPATTTADTFPPADPRGQELPHHRRRQQLAASIPTRRTPARSATAPNFGERSDTIMVWRVDPSTNQVAVLSFPRDLYVDRRRRQQGPDQLRLPPRRPQRLQDTIFLNFEIPIDHYIQVDFCAFKRLVDGGRRRQGAVRVPGARHRTPGSTCQPPVASASSSTATTRSPTCGRGTTSTCVDGEWKPDGTSDFGRISRQQDFLRRTVASLLSRGPFSPSVATRADQDQPPVPRHRHRAHRRPDARVRRRAALARPERDHVVPDRVELAERSGPVGADPEDQGRQHAGDPRHLPWRGAARRGARSDLRVDDQRGRPLPGVTDRRRPHRPRRPTTCRRSGPRRTRSGSRRPATSRADLTGHR